MDWFEGTIPEAVQMAKEKGKWLLVAIPGESKSSKKLESLIYSSQVRGGVASDRYICLRLREDSMDYLQFLKMFPNSVEVTRGDDNSRIYVESRTALPSATEYSTRTLSLQEQLMESRKLAALKHQLELEERQRQKFLPSPEKKSVERRTWQSWQDMDKCLKHAEEVKQKKLEEERHRQQLRGWIADDRVRRNMIPNAVIAKKDSTPKTPGVQGRGARPEGGEASYLAGNSSGVRPRSIVGGGARPEGEAARYSAGNSSGIRQRPRGNGNNGYGAGARY